ncbi:hypothetical protein MNBD_GAMMA10-2795 [hydrothermal vent metagenome]|uniref:Serine protease, subtilase family n=1 Tax=hydrothermal vent metagenome TaxID=652676 RepID=A0A3B0XKA4_9ZZZZ
MILKNSLLRSTIAGMFLGMTCSSPLLAINIEGLNERPQPASRLNTDPAKATIDITKTRAALLAQRKELFVRLETFSVAEYIMDEVNNGRATPDAAMQTAHAKMVDGQQQALNSALSGLDVDVISSYRVGINGFRANVQISAIGALLALPGVRSVTSFDVHTRSLQKSVPWIGVPEVWEKYSTGEGISIAVIDSGIDYLHANFGGRGDPAEFAANDQTIIEPGSFPTEKVVGGFDFAGAAYNPGDPDNSIPIPDPDPIDNSGHGSHVAGIAAGVGVPGEIGPGVAKGAKLYALKVFGDVGGTTLTADAIEWALDPNGDGSTDDHVDVINMSLGTPLGSADSPLAIASQNASEIGVIVVAAAGNEGGAAYVTASPAIAPGVISVAASLAGPQVENAIRVTAPAAIAADYSALEATFTPQLADIGPINGDLLIAQPLDACAPLVNSGDMPGKIALIQRGSCDFSQKAQAAEDAGAIGFVVFNNVPDEGPISMGGEAGPGIAGVMIATNEGILLADTLATGETVSLILDASIVIQRPDLDDTIASFSSRGPGLGGSSFKPDLSAPGSGIVSTGFGTGRGALSLSGTSMASPHIAGLSALILDINPHLKPAGIKAIMQNSTRSAAINPLSQAVYPLAFQGTGIVQAQVAATLSSFVSPAGVSFGRLNPALIANKRVHVVLHNRSHYPRLYEVSHQPNQSVAGVEVHGPRYVWVPASGKKKVPLHLKMRASASPADDGLYSQTEVDGWFTFNDGVDSLRVGYLAVVDPASAMSVRADAVGGGVVVKNRGVSTGFAEGFTLVGKDGTLLDNVPNAIKALGYRSSNFFDANNIIEFGISTEHPWESASVYEIDLLIDADGDGEFETTLIAIDQSLLTGTGNPGERLSTAIFNPQGGFLLFDAVTDMNDSVAVLPFFRNDIPGVPLGMLPEGDTDFDYQLLIFDLNNGSVDIQTGSIDLANESVPEAASFSLDAHTDAALGVVGSAEMLWLFQNNRRAKQSQFVTVQP